MANLGGHDLFSTQQDILAHAVASIPFPIMTGGVPDSSTVRQVNGFVEPYVVLRFSDAMPASGEGSFGGAVFDGQYSYVDAICIAGPASDGSDSGTRQLVSKVNRSLLGFKPYNGGELNKNYGGGVFIMPQNNSMPLAYLGIVSFQFSTNVTNVGAL